MAKEGSKLGGRPKDCVGCAEQGKKGANSTQSNKGKKKVRGKRGNEGKLRPPGGAPNL